MRFGMDLQPRFDYGRAKHKTELSAYGAEITGSDGMRLTVHMVGRQADSAKNGSALKRAGNGLRASWTLREGETAGVVIESMSGPPKRMRPDELKRMLDDTTEFWRDWLSKSTYTGRWREMVSRSAMTLKLLTYNPTGAPVAAATAGLPERSAASATGTTVTPGSGTRSFSIYALLGLGYTEEAAKFGSGSGSG